MRIVSGNKIVEMTAADFEQKVSQFNKCIVDLGTGDGRFVYEQALTEPTTLYIGIDPAQNQMKEFSAKVNRKRLKNVLLVVGSAEVLPVELSNIADQVFIILPWGSLLEQVVKPTDNFLSNLKNLLKRIGEVAIIFGYSPELEPSETVRLGLKEINKEFVEKEVVPLYTKAGFQCDEVVTANSSLLENLSTSWAKNLQSTKERPLFMLTLRKN
jgi:16S rRNA (adenine(1408)-N(1))-methyltransferase